VTAQTWDAYDASAKDYIARYESYSTPDALENVEEIIKRHTGVMLDIGAGTGRDAHWFSARGFHVTAVEPSDEFRRYGQSKNDDVVWVNGALPNLNQLQGQEYDFILLNASWQHVPIDQRQNAFATLYQLCKKGGRMLITLRQGPVPDGRIMHPTSYAEIETLASDYPDLHVSGAAYSRKSLLYPDVVFGRAIIDKKS